MNSGFNQYVVGVGKTLWRGSTACGQCLQVMNQDKLIEVVIADYCPPPCTPKQLDLNPAASAALNPHKSMPKNYYDLKVRKVQCHWKHNMTFHLDKGSSVYNWYLIPLYIQKPLENVVVLKHNAVHDLYGRWVVSFKTQFPKCNSVIPIFSNRGKIRTEIKFNC
jgi:hypothetical protein